MLNGVNNGTSFGATSAHGVVVQAQSTEKMLNLVVAGGAGFVGVSGAVGVTLIGSNTTAFIGHNAQINQVGNASAAASQSVYVNASNDVHVTSFVGAIAGGFVGVGGAVAVGSLKNNTKAEIQSGAHVAARNDVEVNAVAIDNVTDYTLSGGGGFVGLAASVSVWSIGTPLQKNYSDNDGHSASATQGNSGSADNDAAQQAVAARSQVSSLLTGYGDDGSGDPNTSANQVSSASHGAATRLDSDAPSSGDITGAINGGALPEGVTASIASGAVITAGDDRR